MLFVEYPTCSTCKKAKSYLVSHGIDFEARNIKEENPTAEELGAWVPKSGKEIKAFFNTSGQVYRSENIKDKLPNLSEDEKLALLATNGMLVKRPILILPDTVLVGFKEAEWDEALRRNGFLK
ncbi:arsenate reductase family protein [uncultured Veillonella sp.]|uniref:arsenate reductase family protein n=1 Tax=uncultured Veillonella sp. TaxID=159268 RepID=UPI00261B2B17|nr:arsenate reductase family protein [uncultured Veillonella sp.]